MNNQRVGRLNTMMDNADFLIEDLGSVYTDMRRDCISDCSKLMDTHELTIAEKNCAKNCFKKLSYAYINFSNLVHNRNKKLESWEEFKKRYTLDPNNKNSISPLNTEN